MKLVRAVLILPWESDQPTTGRNVSLAPLIGISIAVYLNFLLLDSRTDDTFHAAVAQWSFVPASPSPITFVTAMFVHWSFAHLAGNMFFLFMFGDNVEHRLGPWALVATYLVTGTAAGLVYWWVHLGSKVPCAGASGAISGVMGVYAVLFPQARFRILVGRRTGWDTTAAVAIGAWLVEQTVFGIILESQGRGGTAFSAHIGGLLTGVAIGMCLRLAGRGGVESATALEAGMEPPADGRRSRRQGG